MERVRYGPFTPMTTLHHFHTMETVVNPWYPRGARGARVTIWKYHKEREDTVDTASCKELREGQPQCGHQALFKWCHGAEGVEGGAASIHVVPMGGKTASMHAASALLTKTYWDKIRDCPRKGKQGKSRDMAAEGITLAASLGRCTRSTPVSIRTCRIRKERRREDGALDAEDGA